MHSQVHNLASGYYIELPTMICLAECKHGNFPRNFPKVKEQSCSLIKDIAPRFTAHFIIVLLRHVSSVSLLALHTGQKDRMALPQFQWAPNASQQQGTALWGAASLSS